MGNISLLPVVNGNCVTFEIENLLIRDPSIKNYDLFVEFGDGSFTSFQTKEADKETGRSTIFSKFSHLYKVKGKYTVNCNTKAIYSDDGDPTFHSIPLEINSSGHAPCESPVVSKLTTPRTSQGPTLLGSHMPKFLEQNVYVINYDRIKVKQGVSNQLILFYNEVEKPYTQWENRPISAGNRCRHADSVKFIGSGEVERLQENAVYQSDHPDWQNLIKTFQYYVLFEVNQVNGSSHNNIFIDLNAHKELETAIRDKDASNAEHVRLSVCHLTIKGSDLQPVNTYKYKSEPLTRFHDPNYIYVSPEYVDPDDISTTIWTYDLSISNDGKGTASDVKAHVVLDTAFFDLSTIIGVETKPFRHDREEIEADGVSFFWDDIALPGIDFPEDNKLTIRFSIQPKANYVVTDKLSAHAVVEMKAGSISETTMTEEIAVTEIIDSDRTRMIINLDDILTKFKDTQRTV